LRGSIGIIDPCRATMKEKELATVKEKRRMTVDGQ
jgi:hypothetical protein